MAPGEQETADEVHPFEKRQPVAVTLGTSYDEWCLAQIAKQLGYEKDYNYFLQGSKTIGIFSILKQNSSIPKMQRRIHRTL